MANLSQEKRERMLAFLETLKKQHSDDESLIALGEIEKELKSKNLYLGIIEAKKLGLDKVMIGCDVNNIPSDKTLKALGGKLERTGIDPYDGLLTNVYWFDVDETIRRYRYLYGPSIYEKNQQNNINKTT